MKTFKQFVETYENDLHDTWQHVVNAWSKLDDARHSNINPEEIKTLEDNYKKLYQDYKDLSAKPWDNRYIGIPHRRVPKDRQEFIWRILEEWPDTTPMLIYADWLEEQSDILAGIYRQLANNESIFKVYVDNYHDRIKNVQYSLPELIKILPNMTMHKNGSWSGDINGENTRLILTINDSALPDELLHLVIALAEKN